MSKPNFWQFQSPSTDIMQEIIDLYNLTMYFMCFVVFIVFGSLTYIIWRFNSKRNPIPATFDSNLKLEIFWTIVPIIILTIITIPSIALIKKINTTPEANFTIKVTSYQWFWRYKYINHNDIEFDSNLICEPLNKNQIRLLEVDNRLIIPTKTIIRLIFTSGDVIHSFAIPSAGIKMDCIPGKITETWLKINEIGVYRGQCSELCGENHALMPIVVEAVPEDEFQNWIKSHNSN